MLMPRVLAVKGVLVDLDGTPVDAAPDLATAANAMLAELGCVALEVEQVRSFIGEGIAALVRRALDARLSAEEAESSRAPAMQRFERHYEAANGRHSAPHPGVIEGLRAMREQGLKLACVTNKPMRFAEPRPALRPVADRSARRSKAACPPSQAAVTCWGPLRLPGLCYARPPRGLDQRPAAARLRRGVG